MSDLPDAQKRFVYVCTPEGNLKNYSQAVEYCRLVARRGHAPLSGHVMLYGILDNSDPDQRLRAITTALLLVDAAEELWVFGGCVTYNMAQEILCAMQMGKPVLNCFEKKYVLEGEGGRLYSAALKIISTESPCRAPAGTATGFVN